MSNFEREQDGSNQFMKLYSPTDALDTFKKRRVGEIGVCSDVSQQHFLQISARGGRERNSVLM